MAQAETVALPRRWPLVLMPENRNETTQKDAKLINCYMETDRSTKETWIFKRPGIAQYGSTYTGVGRGVFNWLGDLYAIFGDTLYKNGVAIAGTVDTTAGVYRFASCLGTPKLQLGNGVAGYNYDTGSGLVAIAGANWPSAFVKGWAYLDGTTYVMTTDASIRGCAVLNDPTDWSDVLNAIDAQIEPDAGVALAKQLVYVVALKEWTTEIFYDARNAAGSPLGPVQGAKINYGCANQDSVQEMDGALFWLATNRNAAPQVLMLEGLKSTIVSTKPVERLLGQVDVSDVLSLTVKYEGHRFYVLTFRADNLTLVYDVTEQMWSQWTDPDGNYFPIVSSTYLADNAGTILQHESNGKLYTIDYSNYTDDGDLITCDLYTPNFDGGVRRKKQLNALEFIADQVEGSHLYVRSNDDDFDGEKWTNFRRVDLGEPRPMLTNCGTFRRRTYHLRHQQNLPFRLQGMELQIDLGTL
jgi:hypothetical protein